MSSPSSTLNSAPVVVRTLPRREPSTSSSLRVLTTGAGPVSPTFSPPSSPLPTYPSTHTDMASAVHTLAFGGDKGDALRPRRSRVQRTGSGGDISIPGTHVSSSNSHSSSSKQQRVQRFNVASALGGENPHSWKAKASSGVWRFVWLVVHTVLFVVLVFAVSLVAKAKYGSAPVDYSALTSQDINWSVDVRQLNLTPYNASFGNYNVILDTHAHTTVSDGKLTPETLLDYAIAQGYNALVVSDHNSIEGGLEAERIAKAQFPDGRLVVIPAVEYTCCRVHMNLIGINETIAPPRPFPTDEELRAAIVRTHQLGGLVIVNHFSRSNSLEPGYDQYPNATRRRLPGLPTLDQLVALGVDGFEVVDRDTFDLLSLQYAQQHKLITVTGSNVHSPDGNAGWTLVRAHPAAGPAVAKEDIIEALRVRNNTFVFDSSSTPYRIANLDRYANPSYTFMSPLLEMGEYAQNLVYTVYQGMYSFVPTTVTAGTNTTDIPASAVAPRVASDNAYCHPKIVQTRSSPLFAFICWTGIFVVFYFGLLVLAGRELKQRIAYWRWSNREWTRHAETLTV